VEGARCNEQDVVSLYRKILCLNGRAIDQRKKVALNPFAADIGALPLGTRGDLVDLVEEDDAVVLHGIDCLLDDLLLIEGTTVSTKYGAVKTDHILFIASGAFHVAKPSDLLPELQGRLPIRVELKALSRDDFKRILVEPQASLVKQYVALLATENLTLEVTDDGVDAIADIAAEVNASVENIGARRLHTIIERVLEDVSFNATDQSGHTVVLDRKFVEDNIGDLARNTDLSKFIL
jgi:ATP-dependent protease HslVU ATPase subunit